jgi:TadE-like protein
MGGDDEGVVRPRRAHRRRRGQAMVEFALVLPLFLFCLIGALDAGLWAVQSSAEVSAVEQAAMIASSAGSSPLSETAPDARAITAATSGRLRSAMFGTSIESWCTTEASGACAPDSTQHCPSTPAEVQAVDGPRVVVVCVSESDPPACTTPPPGRVAPFPPGCDDSPMITVRVIGFVASLVPPGFGPGARGFELPTDISATTHTLRFAP